MMTATIDSEQPVKTSESIGPWYRRPLSQKEILGYGGGATVLILGGIFVAALMTRPPTAGPHQDSPMQTAGVPEFDTEHCLIAEEEIRRGGPPKDGIPSITDPDFIDADRAEYLSPQDRVIGVVIDGDARAYPIRILNLHEAVNDTVGGQPILITYCPLCDSALVFDREVGGAVREFGISGLLYNSNVLLYDRHTRSANESLWSQLEMRAVCGPAAEQGLELELLPSTLTTWEHWQAEHPNGQVMSDRTGFTRDYNRNPYASYFSTDRLMFPVDVDASDFEELRRKEPMIVVQHGSAMKAYPITRLEAAADEEGAIQDEVGGMAITLKITSRSQATVDVSPVNQGDPDPAVAYTFWFAWKAAHPDKPVFD